LYDLGYVMAYRNGHPRDRLVDMAWAFVAVSVPGNGSTDIAKGRTWPGGKGNHFALGCCIA